MRAQEFVSEIESIPGWQFSGGKESLQDYNNVNPSLLKPLPGNGELAYTIENTGHATRILIVDPEKNPTDAIAYLELSKSGLPIKGKPLEVETITVDEDYRGRGLAKALYSIVLTTMKRPLVAGTAQTPGGKRNWLSLSSMPGVEVKGAVQLENRDLAYNLEKTIDRLMQLGGQYLGKDQYSTYWAFDVVPGKSQLQPYIKNSLSKIYGYDVPTTLFAKWVGQ